MKVREGMMLAVVREPAWKTQKKRPVNRNGHFWKVAAVLAALGVAIGYYGGYEPPKPVRPMLRYQVCEGDTLWDITSMYGEEGVDIRQACWQIAEDNDVQDGNIQPGQVLLIQR